MTVLDIIFAYKEGLLLGMAVTLKLSAFVWVSGIIAGTALGYLGFKYRDPIGYISQAILFFISSIPVIVLLFWMHYPLQAILRVNIDPFITSAFTLGTINIFMTAEIVRTALLNFPSQYSLAARACGLSDNVAFMRIELPIILRQTAPSLLGLQVNMLQLTLFSSLISVDELFRVAQRINAIVYRPVEIYSALAVFFLVICAVLNGLALLLKKKFELNFSET